MSEATDGDIDRHLSEWLCSTSELHRCNIVSALAADAEAYPVLLQRARAALSNGPAVCEKLAELAAAVAYNTGSLGDSATALRVQGQALRAMGRHLEAINILQEASQRAASAGDQLFSRTVLIGSIDSLAILDRHNDAEQLATHIADELKTLGSPVDAARALVNLGNLYFRKDMYDRAIVTYEQAQLLFGESADAAISAALHTNIANSLTHLDRIPESLARYTAARQLYAAIEDEVHVAVVDTNLGYLEYVSGNYSQALSHLISAAGVFDRCDRPHEAARCQIDAASAYLSINLYPEALNCCELAQQHLGRVSASYDRGRAHLIAASIYNRMHELDCASSQLSLAEEYFRASRNRVQLAHCALVRGWLHRNGGNIALGANSARRAFRAFRQAGLPGWAAEAGFLVADIRLELNDDATRQMRAIARRARYLGRGWLECRAEYALAKYYRSNGDDDVAMRHLTNAVEALESTRTRIIPEDFHISYINGKEVIYTDLVEYLLERDIDDDLVRALEYVEKSRSRVLLDGVTSNRTVAAHLRTNPALQTIRENLQALREQLSREYFLGGVLHTETRLRSQGAVPPANLVELERSYATLEREYQALSSHHSGRDLMQSSLPALATVQSELMDEEVLVEFCTVSKEICAFLVTRDNLQVVRDISDPEEAARAAQRLRFHMQRYAGSKEYVHAILPNIDAAVNDSLRCLYDLLLAKLLPMITAKRLIIAPHGALHGLPFHAFLGPNGPLIRDYEILYTPSCSVWHAVRKRSARGDNQTGDVSSLVFGIPGSGYENVAREAEQVSTLLPNTILRNGNEATIGEFQHLAPQSTFIHLAAHAEFRSDNPLFSGLRLADGWLQARDVYDMQLKCDLVTLSACSTGTVGIAPGDELMGLTRGFLLAGASNVVASLWAADDKATVELMQRFYQQLALGKAPAAALRNAQLTTYDIEKQAYLWAPFIILGGR